MASSSSSSTFVFLTSLSIVIFFCISYDFWFFSTFQQPNIENYDLLQDFFASSTPTLNSTTSTTSGMTNSSPKLKILHIVTSFQQYDDGARGTVRKSDRLQNVVIPALVKMTQTCIDAGYEIDVYMILGYNIDSKPDRQRLIRESLPSGVGFEFWSNAIPYYGGKPTNQTHFSFIRNHNMYLARQHRYVIRDKLDYYNFFSCWEDDIYMTATHLNTFLDLTAKLSQLQKNSDTATTMSTGVHYATPPSKSDLKGLIPGFIRVEVLVNPSEYPRISSKTSSGNRHQFPSNATIQRVGINPSHCCNISQENHSHVALWETAIEGLSIQYLDKEEEYIALLPCPRRRFNSYWSTRNPNSYAGNPRLFAQQGGWMMTKEQLVKVNQSCLYLPYFHEKAGFYKDGLSSKQNNVEFWSGGYDLFYRCQMQRFMSLKIETFSKQLIYHISNNKQIQRDNSRFVRADDLLGQLHTLRTKAMEELRNKNI